MIDPSELVGNLVDVLRDIPDLVAELGGAERIFAYHDSFPERSSLVHAIHTMPLPSIMAVWQGTGPGSFGGFDVWKHNVTLFLRANGTAYYRLFRLAVKGVPQSFGQPVFNATIHPGCNPMDVPMIQRQTDAEGLDYFEVPLSFVEMGDA
jgi:hypothetical protein